jgi:hypothetical protein
MEFIIVEFSANVQCTLGAALMVDTVHFLLYLAFQHTLTIFSYILFEMFFSYFYGHECEKKESKNGEIWGTMYCRLSIKCYEIG